MKKTLSISLILLIFIAVACNKNDANKSQTVSVSDELFEKAMGLFKPQFVAAESEANPLTDDKIKLGKILYYDTRLSKTGNNSCNSCHNLKTYGVDNLPTSVGDNGGFGTRNSPTVYNAAFHTTQFWDGRAKDVEEQAGMPILNPVEMAIPSEKFLVDRLSKIPMYQDLFKKAFPNIAEPLTFGHVAQAIAAFERTLVTPSPFDKFLAGDKLALTQKQIDGLATFTEIGCQTCHMGSQLGGTMFQKFGLFGDYRDFTKSKTEDDGRKTVTNSEYDKDIFKVPGLRNITKTGPYFHDGSVSDLKEATIIMAKLQLNKELTEIEIDNITAFLESLTGELPQDALVFPAELEISKSNL